MRYLSYKDFASSGLFNSPTTLKRAIESQGFPPGILITPNRRVWYEDEVKAWLAKRPTAPRAGHGKSVAAAIVTAAAARAPKASA